MTKVVTASALMQLVEKGLVDLDAWPGEYIPEFPEGWHVTLRQLLTHSACTPDDDRLTDGLIAYPGESFAPLEEVFTTYVKDYPDLICEPGKASAYSNPPFLALARIIEKVSGEPFATLGDYQILPPWGGLRGTPSDVTHFIQMHLSGGRYGDHQILQPDTVAAMQAMQISTDGSPLGFGLSWWIGKDDYGDYYYHTGDGAGSEGTMRIYPDLGLGVVAMSNVRGYQRDRIVEGLVSAWLHEKRG